MCLFYVCVIYMYFFCIIWFLNYFVIGCGMKISVGVIFFIVGFFIYFIGGFVFDVVFNKFGDKIGCKLV